MIAKVILSNWHGITGSFKLGPRTLLIGPNGSGKSSLLAAIAAALTGYTDLGKKASATMARASYGTARVGVETDDGHTLMRTFTATSKGGATSQIHLDGDLVAEKDLRAKLPTSMRFPTEAIHPSEFIGLSGDKRSAFLFGALGDDAIRPLEPAQVGAAFPWLKGPLPADQILGLLETDRKRDADELERCRATVQRLTGQTGTLPAGTLADWQDKLKAADLRIEELVSRQARAGERGKLATQKADHRAGIASQIKQTEAKLAERAEVIEKGLALLEKTKAAASAADDGALVAARRAVAALTEERIEKAARARELRKQVEAIDIHGSCPTCGTPAETLTGLLHTLIDEAEQAERRVAEIDGEGKAEAAKVAALEAAKAAAEKVPEIEREIRVEKEAAGQYRKFLDRNRADLAALDEAEQKAAADAGAAVEAPEILQAQLDGARAAKAEAANAVRAHTQAQGAKKQLGEANEQMVKLQGQLDVIKDCVARVKKLRDEALEGVAGRIMAPFEVAVGTVFPGAKAFFEVVGADGKPSVDFGLITASGQRVGFDTMSGGERIAMLAAMVAAIQVATIGAPRLVMLEMGEADDTRAGLVRKAVDAIGFEQAVLADCHNLNGAAWDGTVVAMGRRATAQAVA